MMTKNVDKKREQMMMFIMDGMVPQNHMLRLIDKAINWNFIYDLVEEKYCLDNGRPSMDPVMLIKIPFIQYLYGIKSMRQTIKEIEVNVAYRWFLGLDMLDPVPHFSTFGKNYTRRFKDTDLFEQIFSKILEDCMKYKLVNTDQIFVDATHIKACANSKKMRKRIAREQALWYMAAIKIKLHRQIPSDWKLRSVTVSREPSGKYFASLLFCCENQTVEKRPAERFLGIDFAMQGMCVFSTGERAGYPMFYRKAEKKLAREQRKLSHCEKGSRNYQKQKKRVALCHEKIKNQRKDFQHKFSRELAERYDAVCVEDLNLQGMSGGLHLGKGVQDNGYGQFLSMLGYKLEERGKYLIKVDRYFASSKICSVCGHKKKELALSDRMYVCECGNRMDRDVNAAVNIREEGKRIYKECA